MALKIVHTQTRWYFSTFLKDGYEVSGCVEFCRGGNGKRQVNVFDRTGRTLLWKSTGFNRADGKTAKLAFQVYVESEAKKAKKPMKLAFRD